tara:strand:+ start:4196 stop:4990 length:795 start_codon:yes stop_codon:yes gene_type:complete
MDNYNKNTDVYVAKQGNIDISKIKYFKANRDISEKEVMKKISLFNQYGFLDAIKVFYFEEDDSIYCAEGQHRIEAAKILGIEKVPCIVIDWVKKDDEDRIYDLVRMYNTNQYQWNLAHYIKHFADLGYIDYQYVLTMMDEYKETVSQAAVVTCYFGNASSRKRLKAGLSTIKDKAFSDNLLSRISGLATEYGERMPTRSLNYIAGHIVSWNDNKEMFLVATMKEVNLVMKSFETRFPDGAESIGEFFRNFVERSYNNMIDNESK